MLGRERMEQIELFSVCYYSSPGKTLGKHGNETGTARADFIGQVDDGDGDEAAFDGMQPVRRKTPRCISYNSHNSSNDINITLLSFILGNRHSLLNAHDCEDEEGSAFLVSVVYKQQHQQRKRRFLPCPVAFSHALSIINRGRYGIYIKQRSDGDDHTFHLLPADLLDDSLFVGQKQLNDFFVIRMVAKRLGIVLDLSSASKDVQCSLYQLDTSFVEYHRPHTLQPTADATLNTNANPEQSTCIHHFDNNKRLPRRLNPTRLYRGHLSFGSNHSRWIVNTTSLEKTRAAKAAAELCRAIESASDYLINTSDQATGTIRYIYDIYKSHIVIPPTMMMTKVSDGRGGGRGGNPTMRMATAGGSYPLMAHIRAIYAMLTIYHYHHRRAHTHRESHEALDSLLHHVDAAIDYILDGHMLHLRNRGLFGGGSVTAVASADDAKDIDASTLLFSFLSFPFLYLFLIRLSLYIYNIYINYLYLFLSCILSLRLMPPSFHHRQGVITTTATSAIADAYEKNGTLSAFRATTKRSSRWFLCFLFLFFFYFFFNRWRSFNNDNICTCFVCLSSCRHPATRCPQDRQRQHMACCSATCCFVCHHQSC